VNTVANQTTQLACRKKVVGIKIASRKNLVKERHCFKCGKQGHIARMCNEKKIAVLSEENKNTSTYSSSKEKREERIRKRLNSL
jgi:Zinc knuckle